MGYSKIHPTGLHKSPPTAVELARPLGVSDALARWLVSIGVRLVFGVSGGGVAPLWAGLSAEARLDLVHCQHESGAAFAAAEASLASDAPVAVFMTTGPGLTNALTGLVAARAEGARLIVLSGVSPAARRGRGATQETHASSPLPSLFSANDVFDCATIVESAEMLPAFLHKAQIGLQSPGGFVAHLGLPSDVQRAQAAASSAPSPATALPPAVAPEQAQRLARLLAAQRFVIWAGFDARRAADEIAELAQRSGARVMCTPRAKGIFPETHGAYLGVTGFVGHVGPEQYMEAHSVDTVLVLGSALGEGDSQWSEALQPRRQLIQVHPRASQLGGAFPGVATIAVQADVKNFLRHLLAHYPEPPDHPRPDWSNVSSFARGITAEHLAPLNPRALVRPQVLMAAIQRVFVEGSGATVMAESGNSFAWAIHHLRFSQPGRWRTSVGWGAMGHFTTGVIGAALVNPERAVAIVGDGAMLMQNEVATAARHHISATWIVLNDGQYNMCRQGMGLLGYEDIDASLPAVNFAALARSLGARGLRVEHEANLEEVLLRASTLRGPVVVDVAIDPEVPAPIARRIQKLTWHEQ